MANPASTPDPMDAYQAAVQADPGSAVAQCNLGWGYYGQQRYSEAIDTFGRAIDIDGSLLDAHYGLGLAAKAANIRDRALAAFDKAAALAATLDEHDRREMLLRLLHGHVNQLKTGEWELDQWDHQ